MNLDDHVWNDMLDNIERRISPPWGTKTTAYQIDLDPVHAWLKTLRAGFQSAETLTRPEGLLPAPCLIVA